MNWKLTRRIAFGVLLFFMLVIAKGAGVFIDFFLLTVYGLALGGVWAWKHLYLGGLGRIAKTNAKAIVDEQEAREQLRRDI